MLRQKSLMEISKPSCPKCGCIDLTDCAEGWFTCQNPECGYFGYSDAMLHQTMNVHGTRCGPACGTALGNGWIG